MFLIYLCINQHIFLLRIHPRQEALCPLPLPPTQRFFISSLISSSQNFLKLQRKSSFSGKCLDSLPDLTLTNKKWSKRTCYPIRQCGYVILIQFLINRQRHRKDTFSCFFPSQISLILLPFNFSSGKFLINRITSVITTSKEGLPKGLSALILPLGHSLWVSILVHHFFQSIFFFTFFFLRYFHVCRDFAFRLILLHWFQVSNFWVFNGGDDAIA